MKSRASFRVRILILFGIVLISGVNCRKSEEPSVIQLLTSSLWSLTSDWSGRSISDEEFSITTYKLTGEYIISSNIRDEIIGTWNLKEDNETLIMNGLDCKIVLLKETELKITSTAIEGICSFKALTSTIASTVGISALTSTSVTLNGTLRTSNPNTEVTFEYGTTTSYGKLISATESPVSGPTLSRAYVVLSGLLPETIYHYRIKVVNSSGTIYGQDISFKTFTAETVTDIDGNVYNTVKIGTQVWMAEDLKVTKYRNGDPIPNITDNTQWKNLTSGAYCNYRNDNTNVTTYGLLYNWYAVMDSRTLAPTGWHVATDSDWSLLTGFLGGEKTAGSKLKETGSLHWDFPNSDATNESGFTALPGGDRSFDGTFNYITTLGFWWCFADGAIDNIWGRSMIRGFGNVDRFNEVDHERSGLSVRCIKN